MTLLDTNVFFFYPIIIIVLIAVATLLIIPYALKKSKQVEEALQNQAHKRNGIISRRWLFSHPTLSFNHGAYKVKVYTVPGGKNSPPHTYVDADLNLNLNQYMRLYKEGFAARFGKRIGAQDIQTGIDSFDREVMIKGSDEYFVRNILTYDVQDAALKAINKHKAQVILKNNKLSVFIANYVDTSEKYDDLIELNLRILDQIKEKGSYFSKIT